MLDRSARTTFSVPLAFVRNKKKSLTHPAPMFITDMYIPTVQKQTNPTKATCVIGELSESSNPRYGLQHSHLIIAGMAEHNTAEPLVSYERMTAPLSNGEH
jgi:hypothetical protein